MPGSEFSAAARQQLILISRKSTTGYVRTLKMGEYKKPKRSNG
jgi:hypothetical protein